jgi:hypothetical protein
VAAGVFAVYSIIEGGMSATRPPRALPVVSPRTCRSGQLRLSWIGDGAATGKSFLNFAFTNASEDSCVLQGRASMGVVLAGGRRVALRAIHIPNQRHTGKSVPARRIVLRPGGAASFTLLVPDQFMYDKPPKCLRLRAVLVTPPGSTLALRIDKPPFEFCGQRFDGFTPLVPGRIDPYMA